MRVATTAPLLAAALLLLCAGTPQTQALVPFPMPRSMTQGDGSTPVNVSALFAFACDTTAGCDQVACSSSAITTAAMTRFEALIRPNQAPLGVGSRTPNGDALSSATVCIVDDNEYLGQTTDETYTLTVPTSGGVAAIKANTVFGAMHAMESLAQVADTTTSEHTIANAPISIDDGPRFGYRGLLVDTARHFLPMDHLKHVVDGLSASKLNVMHWHIVDAQSFAYGSTKFPQLAEKGAYSSQAIFSPAAIADLVQYAKSECRSAALLRTRTAQLCMVAERAMAGRAHIGLEVHCTVHAHRHSDPRNLHPPTPTTRAPPQCAAYASCRSGTCPATVAGGRASRASWAATSSWIRRTLTCTSS